MSERELSPQRRPGEGRDPYRVIYRRMAVFVPKNVQRRFSAKPLPVVMGPGLRRDDREGVMQAFRQTCAAHNSLAFENAKLDTRLVVSSKISVRVIGGSAR